jgi:hypothetical protein
MDDTHPTVDTTPTVDLTPTGGPAPAVVALERTGPKPLVRIGLLGIGAAALIAVAILAAGASALPGSLLAAVTGSGASGAGGNATTDSGPALFGGEGFLGGGPGPGGRGGHAFGGGITITAISGSDISLETEDGWNRTITVDSGTTYSKSGDEIALSDLAVGDEIAFRQTREDDGTFTIDAIAVIPPHAGGEVTAVSGSTITVEQRDGTTTTINVNGDTDYQVNGDDATLADVEVGMLLIAQGTENADGSLTATDVRAADPDSFPGRPGHGFRKVWPGPDGGDGTAPDATTAPNAEGSAS